MAPIPVLSRSQFDKDTTLTGHFGQGDAAYLAYVAATQKGSIFIPEAGTAIEASTEIPTSENAANLWGADFSSTTTLIPAELNTPVETVASTTQAEQNTSRTTAPPTGRFRMASRLLPRQARWLATPSSMKGKCFAAGVTPT